MNDLDDAGPLLETKLYIPKPRRGLVARSRLSELLSRGAESKLTLISAPAGFGKSTLLAEWLASGVADGSSVAWLSLDPSDNDPAAFWMHVIAALRTAAPEVGGRAIALMTSPGPPSETSLAALLNELNAVAQDLVLVLDDYHTVSAPEIQVGMAYLLEHLPTQIHVVIATRADPGLPLARLRARGELVEIRAADLRFTPDEAAAYLTGEMGFALEARDVAALEARTEGWIAALQLAAISMQGREDVHGFIAGFSGDDRYIVDYLVEEVLHRQPDAVRDFLLQTAILDRMSGSLCDALTGQGDGRAMLETLDRGNLFLVPLDDRRQWYRYHHLFADVLRARLLDERPEVVADLHRRASDWYEGAGERPEAIRHAMAGGHFARAADLVELAVPATTRGRQEVTLRGWLDALPDALVRERPVLSNAYAGAILVWGETEGVETRLRDAERWLETADDPIEDGSPRSSMVVVDQEAFRALPMSIAVHRAGQTRILGDVAGSMTHARRVLDLAGPNDHLACGAAAALLGLGHWTNGDLDDARRWYTESIASLQKAGYLADAIGCDLTLADILIAQGRLSDAMRVYEHGLAISSGQGLPVLRGTADMHVGMSRLSRERNDLEAATEQLRMAHELGDGNGLPQNPYRSRVAAAMIQEAEGDLDGALELLGEAARLYVGDFSPDVRPVAALRARVWIAQGKLAEAWGWARERDLSPSDALTYLREAEHTTLARLLLAQGVHDRSDEALGEAADLLERLLRQAEGGGRNGSAIEILAVLAVARHARGDAPGARAALARAVALAAPEGYVRVFLDEGPPMTALLRVAAKQRDAADHLRRLLAAAGTTERGTAVGQPLIEPLSERELEVLRLLQSDLDGPDMARELVVSLNTVRTHTKNIYAKLGVNNRRAAVRRAAELGLLSRSRDERPTP